MSTTVLTESDSITGVSCLEESKSKWLFYCTSLTENKSRWFNLSDKEN